MEADQAGVGTPPPGLENEKEDPALGRSSSEPSVGPDLPLDGILVTFEDVSYTIRVRRVGKVDLLQAVTGHFKAGEMAALMGPSGSGKTTLLDVLSGRKTVGRIRGEVRYGGLKPTRDFLRVRTAYVEQFDSLLANMSVAENLQYTCEMRAEVSLGKQVKRQRVEDVIEALDLGRCRDVRVGSNLARGISGGQAKRVNIGIALVASPRVLFLDEPTTGLDSYTAHETMLAVARLAARGLTVCATVHSPPPGTVALFSSLSVLIKGRLVYFGPNGSEALDFFRSAAGFLGPSPMGRVRSRARVAPAAAGDGAEAAAPPTRLSDIEWMTDVVVRADRAGEGARLTEAYEASATRERMSSERADLLADAVGAGAPGGAPPAAAADGSAAAAAAAAAAAPPAGGWAARLPGARRRALAPRKLRSSGTSTPALHGYATLLRHRGARDLTDLGFILPRLLDKLVMGFILFTLFWHQGKDLSSPNIPNVVVVLFMWTLLVAYSAGTYMPSLLMERALYIRERNDGLYASGTYLAFKLTEEYGLQLLISLPISAMVFYPTSLHGSWALFWLIYYVTSITGIAMGYLIAAVAPSMDFANAFLPLIVTILLFFCGLLIRFDDMPSYWRWFAYIDFLRYSWGALMINQFQGLQTFWFFFETLSFFSLDTYSKWIFMVYTLCSTFFFILATWVALTWVKHVVR